jgi:hypothetical protein
VWQGFEPAKREQPIKIGLIEIEPQWGGRRMTSQRKGALKNAGHFQASAGAL